MAKVYVTQLSGTKGVQDVFASLDILKRHLVASGRVSKQFTDQLDSMFINHSITTIIGRGFEHYNLLIQEVEITEE